MKRRFLVDKAEWSDEREEHYKKDSHDIVFSFGDRLEITDHTVYILKNDEQIEISKPYKSKAFW